MRRENGCEGVLSPLSGQILELFILDLLVREIVHLSGIVREFQKPLPVATMIYMILITQTFNSNKRKWLLIWPLSPNSWYSGQLMLSQKPKTDGFV